MNKTALKIFTCFTALALALALTLLAVNAFALAITASDTTAGTYAASPRRMLNNIAENLEPEGDGYLLRGGSGLPDGFWCILIAEDGNVVWNQNMPQDIPTHYSINDIARMTRWFLNDYPVYVRTEDYGLLVLGCPKNSIAKYPLEYTLPWFETLPQRLGAVILFNAALALLLACVFGRKLYVRMRQLADGIREVKQERPVHLKEKGIFRELSRYLNETSAAIQHKNALLRQRDAARSNWISGISHDIRTPLSIILGHSEELAESAAVDTREHAAVITAQTLKIKKLVEDLNLISSLEYDMQPGRKKPVRICGLLRRVVSDILNSGLTEQFEIEPELRCEKAVVNGDASLLERAFFNLINNSVRHNPNGCRVRVAAVRNKPENSVCITIADNGSGVDGEVLRHLDELPKTAHGVGLPLAYKIITVHGGTFTACNHNGFLVEITLPLA